MITSSGIRIPENLFKAIDSTHKEATEIYGNLSSEAVELISPTRGSKEITNNSKNDSKNKLKV